MKKINLLSISMVFVSMVYASSAMAKADSYDKRIISLCANKQFIDAKNRGKPITKAQASSLCSCFLVANTKLSKQYADDEGSEQHLSALNQEALVCAAKNGVNVTPMM